MYTVTHVFWPPVFPANKLNTGRVLANMYIDEMLLLFHKRIAVDSKVTF